MMDSTKDAEISIHDSVITILVTHFDDAKIQPTALSLLSGLSSLHSYFPCENYLTRNSLGFTYVNLNKSFKQDPLAALPQSITLQDGHVTRFYYSTLGMTSSPHPGSVMISNLEQSVTKDDLFLLCSKFGKVVGVKISEDPGNAEKYGFVYFEKEESVGECRENMSDTLLNGQKIQVCEFPTNEMKENVIKANFAVESQSRLDKIINENIFFFLGVYSAMLNAKVFSLTLALKQQTATGRTTFKFDLEALKKNVETLNQMSHNDFLQKEINNKTASTATLKEIPIIFYINGIVLPNGIFHSFDEITTRQLIQDLIDGSLPSEFQKLFPEGFLMKISDLRPNTYPPQQANSHAMQGYNLPQTSGLMNGFSQSMQMQRWPTNLYQSQAFTQTPGMTNNLYQSQAFMQMPAMTNNLYHSQALTQVPGMANNLYQSQALTQVPGLPNNASLSSPAMSIPTLLNNTFQGQALKQMPAVPSNLFQRPPSMQIPVVPRMQIPAMPRMQIPSLPIDLSQGPPTMQIPTGLSDLSQGPPTMQIPTGPSDLSQGPPTMQIPTGLSDLSQGPPTMQIPAGPSDLSQGPPTMQIPAVVNNTSQAPAAAFNNVQPLAASSLAAYSLGEEERNAHYKKALSSTVQKLVDDEHTDEILDMLITENDSEELRHMLNSSLYCKLKIQEVQKKIRYNEKQSTGSNLTEEKLKESYRDENMEDTGDCFKDDIVDMIENSWKESEKCQADVQETENEEPEIKSNEKIDKITSLDQGLNKIEEYSALEEDQSEFQAVINTEKSSPRPCDNTPKAAHENRLTRRRSKNKKIDTSKPQKFQDIKNDFITMLMGTESEDPLENKSSFKSDESEFPALNDTEGTIPRLCDNTPKEAQKEIKSQRKRWKAAAKKERDSELLLEEKSSTTSETDESSHSSDQILGENIQQSNSGNEVHFIETESNNSESFDKSLIDDPNTKGAEFNILSIIETSPENDEQLWIKKEDHVASKENCQAGRVDQNVTLEMIPECDDDVNEAVQDKSSSNESEETSLILRNYNSTLLSQKNGLTIDNEVHYSDYDSDSDSDSDAIDHIY